MSKQKYSLVDCTLGSAEHCHIFAMLNLDLACAKLEGIVENDGNPSLRDRMKSDSANKFNEAMEAFIVVGSQIPPEAAKRLLTYFEGEKRRLDQQKFDAATPSPPPPDN